MSRYRYEKIADILVGQMEAGVYGPGDRLPGVHRLTRQLGVSVSTVVSALHLLEDRGLVETRARSGCYVRGASGPALELPRRSEPEGRPTPVTGHALVMNVVRAVDDPRVVQLGAAIPHPDYLPLRGLRRALSEVPRRHGDRALGYAFPPGPLELRQQVARRLAEAGAPAGPDEIVITDGCQEAVSLALRAVTRPGDVVAIESPCFYGLLQAIEGEGLKALEIPTDPEQGVSPEALELALDQWPVAAVLLTPNFSNPLGHRMPDVRKEAMVRLLEARGVPLIEDDVFGDLAFAEPRPWVAKAYEQKGGVLCCGSVSKTLSPGLRVGWIAPGRFRDRVEQLKYAASAAAPAYTGLAVADFLQRGYERYLRRARREYERAVGRVARLVDRYLPAETRRTRPQGGFVLWLELPEEIDSRDLYRYALAEGISIAPGPMFSPGQRYRNCLRLNCAAPADERLEWSLKRLGQLVAEPRGPD